MQVADSDQTIADEEGTNRKIFEGTSVPPDLVEAYEEAGGNMVDAAPQEGDAVIAQSDQIITDEDGTNRKIFAGTEVPAIWIEAYEDAGGQLQTGPERAKMQTEAETVKAEEAEKQSAEQEQIRQERAAGEEGEVKGDIAAVRQGKQQSRRRS